MKKTLLNAILTTIASNSGISSFMTDLKETDYIVVGCGFWGSVFAERIASVLNKKVVIVEKRDHIAGNCYSEIDKETQIEFHKYGSHIFHTSSEKVWNYLNNFGKFNSYRHKVITVHKGKHYIIPINLLTINDFYGLNLQPYEAEKFLDEEIKKYKIENPQNLEEKAISQIGKPLYEAFIKGYTEKQWNCPAKDLPVSIINRLPVRRNFRTSYFEDTFEGIPIDGWTNLFRNILKNSNISVRLNTDFFDIKDQLKENCKIIYTGQIDKLLNFKYGRLDWIGLDFKFERFNCKDWQGTSVMNYSDSNVPQTRTHEFKHLHLERKEIFEKPQTIICYEYPQKAQENDEIFYPVNTDKNMEIYEKYKKECENKNIILGGRLGLYKYMNMDTTVKSALETFEKYQGVL